MTDGLAKLRGRRLSRAMSKLDTSRTCDGCDVCCFALPIRELEKPAGVSCEHRCGDPGSSCAIYERRPRVCREFLCMWRMTDQWLPDWAKPSAIGFVLTFNDLASWPGVVTVSVDPARPDAWRTLHAQTILASLAEHLNCMVAIGFGQDCTHVITPDGRALKADQLRRGSDIGAPDFTFGPDRRPLGERLRELKISWSLPAP